MLHLIPQVLLPAPLHRLAFRTAHALRKRWWRLRRPRLRGCRAIAVDDLGRVLLVRHSYGSGEWMAPGGRVEKGESPVASALRELREETGCDLLGAREIAVIEQPLHGASNVIHIVAGRTRDMPVPDGREIVAAAFFALDALPADLQDRLREPLPGWVRAATTGRPSPPLPTASPPPVPRG